MSDLLKILYEEAKSIHNDGWMPKILNVDNSEMVTN